MSKSKEKQFKKLKNAHTISSIVIFIIQFIMLVALLNVVLTFFTLFLIDIKVDNESKLIRQMAQNYEEGNKNNINYDYVVFDKNNKKIEESGVNTCSDKGGVPGTLFGKKDYTVFEDKDNKTLFFDDGGIVTFNLFAPDFSNDDISVYVSSAGELDDINVEGNADIDVPLWIGIKLSNGNTFVAKAHITARLVELIVFIIMFAAVNVFLFVFLIIRLVRIIRGVIRRKRITELFLIDEVTKGNNWMGFLLGADAILKKRNNAEKRYAIMHIVIVKYRNYCMCHSLEEGKKILYRIAGTIEQNIDKKTEICGHVSSSSFALLIEAPTDESVRERFDKLLSQLSDVDSRGNTQQMAGHPDVFKSFSFQAGVHIIEPNVVDGHKTKRKNVELEKHYNNAVTAKATIESSTDSGIAFFDEKLMENEKWTETVEEHQQKALDNEEFVVYYQPKYSPEKCELVGAEALIRWQSPEFGFVPPGRFIPIFENNGFITAIDHYMICHVVKQQKKWLDEGVKCVPVSVNVSRAHFAESDLAEQILNMVDAEGLPHNYIEIELTESAFFDDKDMIIETIDKLKEYGFSVSMDDFGSGYSSLNSLKDMDLDVLKLDAEFFRGDADSNRKEAVVSEAIKLAKRLKMRTVAEGVEDKDEVEFLEKQGCDMIQGYYFAKPMPAEEYEERMNEVYHVLDE